MHNTTPPRKDDNHFTIKVTDPRGNIFPIQMQIDMAKMAKRHNKRNTRNKQKQWRKEQA